jgi:putative ABC transport system ATP-binding protein
MRIIARGLGQTYTSGGRPLVVLRDVDLEIAPEEFVAIVGPSGSGKTTLLGLLAGLDRPSAGDVTIDGRSLAGLTEDDRARFRAAHIGFVFQTFQLIPTLTALENVLVPIELSPKRKRSAAKVAEGAAEGGGRGGNRSGAEVAEGVAAGGGRGGNGDDPRRRAESLLARVGLGDRVDHYPAQLSGGEQQRVALARAFANRPRILFADEPTGNLDAATGGTIIGLLEALNREERATLVLVTHDPALAERAGRVIRIAAGTIAGIDVNPESRLRS